jgi:cytochrome c-type biogenesis protein CcmH
MLQYVLTGLAGIVLGIVAMRVWQAREAAPQAPADQPAEAPSPAPAGTSSRKLLLGAGGLVVLAAAIFAFRSAGPGEQPVAAGPLTAAAGSAKALDDVDTMITRLAARLEKEPNDGEGFRMLGWSYVMTGKPDKAIAPYQRALKLLPGNALVHSGYGEAMTGVAGGKVTPEAKAEFDRAVAIDPADPRARHFLALWQAQHGQEREALDKWIALANSGPSDLPWQADVRRQIDTYSKKLGVDVAARLKQAAAPASAAAPGTLPPPDPAAVAAANQMSATDRQAMIDGMVDGLARKLKANPDNPEGWVKLLRSRMVLGQPEQASSELKAARKALSANPSGLQLVDAVAREIKVPGA